jgi:3-(3-hydroxy-phenyl)propionate hydroxylase
MSWRRSDAPADHLTASSRIIVIGAGPVGLCLSLALAKDGVEVTVIEALRDDNFLEQVPRAGTNHPATLELFDRIGLYARIEPRGIIAPLFHYWDRREQKRIAEFDHVHLKEDTRFPYVLQCERIKIVEEALKLARAHRNIDVRLGTTFISFEQGADGVTAFAANPAGETEAFRGAYLVSCEGARSIVRKDLEIGFEGFTYPDRTLNIEVAYDFRKNGYTERNYISDPDEWSNLFHWKGPPDRWRIHFPTEAHEDEEAITREVALQARLQRFLPIGKPFEIVGTNLYVVHQRVAQKFRVGRAILAGDSAHVNSPIGAMGMNSGVHDAFNLADKLVRILRGEADEEVLDRYERQRRHVAVQHTQAQTIRNKRLLAEKDPAVRQKNNDELRRTAEDPKLARAFLLRSSLIASLREAEQIA